MANERNEIDEGNDHLRRPFLLDPDVPEPGPSSRPWKKASKKYRAMAIPTRGHIPQKTPASPAADTARVAKAA
jgi:hypothetical protein